MRSRPGQAFALRNSRSQSLWGDGTRGEQCGRCGATETGLVAEVEGLEVAVSARGQRGLRRGRGERRSGWFAAAPRSVLLLLVVDGLFTLFFWNGGGGGGRSGIGVDASAGRSGAEFERFGMSAVELVEKAVAGVSRVDWRGWTATLAVVMGAERLDGERGDVHREGRRRRLRCRGDGR